MPKYHTNITDLKYQNLNVQEYTNNTLAHCIQRLNHETKKNGIHFKSSRV